MGNDQQPDVTLLLQQSNNGNEEAYKHLFELVYQQLKKVAHNIKYRRSEFETLNTTALVHEAYLKLSGNEAMEWESRGHFFSLASKAIRHILTDYARRKLAKKREGKKESLDDNLHIKLSYESARDLEALEQALNKLERTNPQVSKIIEYRFYTGMSIQETAEMLDISESTVKRNWAMGKLWLHREIKKIQTPQINSSTPNYGHS